MTSWYQVEDYQGRYWNTRPGHGDRSYQLPCAAAATPAGCTCTVGIELVQDVTGQWYAQHLTHDGRPWTRSTPTVTSPRYDDWQDAARWATTHDLVHPHAEH